MRRYKFRCLFLTASFYIFKFFCFYLVGGIVAGIGSAVSGAFNYFSQKKANATNEKWNKLNYAMQKEQFDYQKYLNNNQIQMQAADAQKAGINPMAMTSSSMSSGNYSNVDSNQQAPQLDLSGVIQAAIAEDSNKNAKSIAESNNQTAESNVQKQVDAQKDMNKDKLDSEAELTKYKEQQTTYRQALQILSDKEASEADRQNALRIAEMANQSAEKIASGHDESNEKIAGDKLKEEQYQFDVKNEQLIKQLNNQAKGQSIDQLSKAYKEWCIENNVPYDVVQGKSMASYLVEQFERGAKSLDKLTGGYKRFWNWYVESGYQFKPNEFSSSSVRRRD